MENGKAEDAETEDANLEIAQLQALVAELRSSLQGALQEMGLLRERDCSLEEKLQTHQSDVDDRIMGLRNSLNTFKEDLSGALAQVKEVSGRQRELQRSLDALQAEGCKDILVVQQSRKSSRGDVNGPGEGEGPACLSSQTELNVIQHYFASLTTSSPHRSTASTQTSNSGEQEQGSGQPQRDGSKSPVWRERKDSQDDVDTQTTTAPEISKRQTAALELLESERVYVSYLSLLLKANISFNGSEVLHAKDKRPFPSSLRFLIQQHLELLHTLQERVLKHQWQGIMGDVFMRLTSKESDFLDFYVSYLKELPECLSVVSMLTSTHMKTASLLESDIMGDETHPSLHTLLLQPVQRIPEYLLLLQTLLKQTDAEHPDYYLLLVCIQQFRSFTAQYDHLLQHNEELLLHNRKELKRSTMKQFFRNMDCGIQANELGSPFPASNAVLEHANQVKRSKQKLLEQIQSRRFQDWERERDGEPHLRYDQDLHPPSPPVPFYAPDPPDPRLKLAGLHSIPESEPEAGVLAVAGGVGLGSSSSSSAHQRMPLPGSALADALGEFMLPGEAPGLEGLYEDGERASLYDQCSDHSSTDSSIDIAFVRCPKSHHAAAPAAAVAAAGSREAYGERRSQGSGYGKLPGRGCVSPDEAALMRHHHRPLQKGQRKSKSLNGLQLDSVVSGGADPNFSDHLRGHQHAKLERQGSKGCPGPTRRGQSSLGTQHRVEPERQAAAPEEELQSDHKESASPPWGEEPRWRGGPDESNPAQFSERSRKQDKGGFRSSFKKLFKKKSGGEGKEKSNEKTENSSDHESGKTPRVHLDIDRGTAV